MEVAQLNQIREVVRRALFWSSPFFIGTPVQNPLLKSQNGSQGFHMTSSACSSRSIDQPAAPYFSGSNLISLVVADEI